MNNISLPDFLGIGAERSGTTWLYNILKAHPEVYLCSFKKEINFFSYYYTKGLSWYKRYFPSVDDTFHYKAIGEITPVYIYLKHTPKLISHFLPDARFLLILRNPIERAISDYKFFKLNTGIKNDFKSILNSKREIYEKGLYANQLKNWFKYFPSERFLILIYEEMVKNPLKSLKDISNFLKIDFYKFDKNVMLKRVNSSGKPRLHHMFAISSKIVHRLNILLTKYSMDKILSLIPLFKKILYLFGTIDKKEIIDLEFKKQLYQRYQNDILNLEELLNYDLSIWKN